MIDYETDMKTLLTDVKSLIKEYADGTKNNNLKGINTFKRGILSSSKTVYPAITVIPMQEIIVQRRSNHKQLIRRDVQVESYRKGYDPKTSFRTLLDDEERIRNIFYDSNYPTNYQFIDGTRPTVFNFKVERYELEPQDDGIIQGIKIPISFYSYAAVSDYTKYSQMESDTKDLGDLIKTTFKSDSNLSNVQFFFDNVIPPISLTQGVAICIKENNIIDDHYELGRDLETREFHIYVWTKLSPFEGSLDLNLDNVENVKNILYSNSMWNGRSLNSQIIEINFGINEQKMMYGSHLIYHTHTRRNLPSY